MTFDFCFQSNAIKDKQPADKYPQNGADAAQYCARHCSGIAIATAEFKFSFSALSSQLKDDTISMNTSAESHDSRSIATDTTSQCSAKA